MAGPTPTTPEADATGGDIVELRHPYQPPSAEQHDVPWRDFQQVTRLVALLAVFGGLFYLAFLLDFSHMNDRVLWVLTLFAEGVVVTHTLGVYFTLLSYRTDIPESEGVAVLHRALLTGEHPPPTIDVFICHATEPLDMVLPTIIAAQEMLLPHNTWVLDDGRDPDLAEACARIGVGYLRRETNAHAKAGNINTAFGRTDGRFVAVLDADHVPRPDFLLHTLPHLLANPAVGFVQTPQTYDYDGRGMIAEGASASQDLFYQAIMPAKNQSNAAFCVGTNVVYRRQALKSLTVRERTPAETRKARREFGADEPWPDVHTALGEEFPNGGIWVGSNSEDIWTSLELHRRGWRSVFVPKVLTRGLTPDTVTAFLKQQFRWACGGWEILLWAKMLRDHRLTLSQKFQYALVPSHFMLSFSVAIFTFLSPIYLLADRSPIKAEFWDWFIHFVPFYVLVLAVTAVQAGKFQLSAVVVSLAAAPAHIRAFFSTLFRRKTAWSVTNSGAGGFNLTLLAPHLFIGLLSILSLIVTFQMRDQPVAARAIAVAWVVIQLGMLVYLIVQSERAGRMAAVAEEEQPDASEALQLLDDYLDSRNFNAPSAEALYAAKPKAMAQ